MAADSFDAIVRKVQLRCPSAGVFLSRQWVDDAFRDLCRQREWSFLQKRGQFRFNDAYETGTVTVTFGSATVTGSGTTFTAAMVGRQFRTGVGSPIYTISAYVSATEITLDQVWAGETASAQSYKIYNAYVTVPSDFRDFVSVIDPNYAWKLWPNVQQAVLDAADPQRANAGQPYILSPTSPDTTTTPPTIRMEVWPHVQQQYFLTFSYTTRVTDLSDAGASLPRGVDGDVLLEMALEQAAMWPGASTEQPNPYFNLNLALLHAKRAKEKAQQTMILDDEAMATDLSYDNGANLQMAPWPLDAKFLQSHDF